MAKPTIPPMLNTNHIIPWEQQYVCPIKPLYEQHNDHIHKQYIAPEDKAQHHTVNISAPVRLKPNRQRIYGKVLVNKPAGPNRKVLKMRDYRYVGDFDKSAHQIMIGERVTACSPYPARRTAQFVLLPEGTYSLDELQFLDEK